MFILEQKYGNNGFSFWFKLLEQLGSTDGHCLDLNDKTAWSFLCAKSRVSEETADEMLNLLAEIEAIDRELWQVDRVIWIQKFVDGIADAYRNRKVDLPTKPSLKRKKPGVSENSLHGDQGPSGVSDVRNPQMKLDETKLNEKKIFSSTSDEVRLGELLIGLILARKPDCKKPNLQGWAKDFDLILRVDKRPLETVEKLIRWVQSDPFEQRNVLSPGKLRERFDQLEMKMQGGSGNANGRSHRTGDFKSGSGGADSKAAGNQGQSGNAIPGERVKDDSSRAIPGKYADLQTTTVE
jgi:hypothetical protein